MLRLHRANEQILLQVQEVSTELKDYGSVFVSAQAGNKNSREQSADSLEDMFKVDPSTLLKA